MIVPHLVGALGHPLIQVGLLNLDFTNAQLLLLLVVQLRLQLFSIIYKLVPIPIL